MKIRRMYLNGFGIYRDRTFELDPAAPAALFYGENEAGKSTMIGFIRTMLFGFPTRANMPERYEPLAGGVHGGILTVADGQGREIRIERYEKNGSLRLLYPDGSEGGAAALQTLVGGITPDLYRNLFAFSLSELQQLETLQQDEVGGFLFSAGMGVSGSAVVQAERKLASGMDELYKPRGSKQEINRLLKELEATEAALRRSKEIGAGYNDMREELSRQDGRIAAGESELERLRAEREWLNKCVQARPAWVKLLEIGRRLGEISAPEQFPEDAVPRLEALLGEEARIARELNEITAKRDRLRDKLAEAKANERLIALRPELERLLESVAGYEESARNAAQLQSELAHAGEQLSHHLRQIDPDWSEDDLRRFPMTVSHREEARAHAGRLAALASRKLASDTELESLERRGDALRRTLEARKNGEDEARRRFEAEFAPLAAMLAGADPETFEAELRGIWEAVRSAAAEVMHMRQRLDEIRHSEATLGAGAADASISREAKPRLRRRQAGFVLAAATALNVALPLWLWIGRDMAVAAGALFAALGLANAAWLPRLLRFARDSGTASEPRLAAIRQSHAERRAELERKLEASGRRWRERLDQLVRRIEAFASNAEAAAAVAGEEVPGNFRAIWGTGPNAESEQEIAAMLARVEKAVAAVFAGLRRYGKRAAELAMASEQTVAAARAVEDWEEERRAALEYRKRLDSEEDERLADWQAWLHRCRLPAALAPETVTLIYRHAEQGMDSLRVVEKLGRQLAAIRKMQTEFEREAAAFIGRFKGKAANMPASGGELIHELKKLKTLLEEQVRLQEAGRHLREQLDELELREAAAAGEQTAAANKLRQLLDEAGASDEEQFRRLARLHAERTTLIEEKHRQEIAIFSWVKTEERDRLMETLEGHDIDQLRHNLQEHERLIAAKRDELNGLRDARGRLRAELDRLGSGEAHGELLQRHQEQIAEFGQLVSRWAQLAICAELIRRSREIYEKDRQPGVLRQASSHFRLITGGKYTRVVSRIGEKTVYVEKENGERLDSAFLSRGTAEQLYLAMRFALADEYAKTASLPLIMDDILVNFDHDRLRRALQVVAEAAKRHQIILFTCHKHVAAAMEAAVPGLQRIDLHT